ncbi:MAG: glycoside hydrolase family 92 protein, partial [bacterium]|nr:glycoside hydrolase family 92 protein [Candidatus Colisoma equi]
MRVVSEARKAWNDKLGLSEVEGGTDDERMVFYTALYRCFERMVDVTEDGHYFGWDRKVHPLPEGRRAYNDDWVWDTFRVHHPLMVLLQPKEQGDKLNSYINFSKENAEGWMPTFPTIGFDAHVMNGLHTVSLFLDAWRKGVRGFDLKAAYAACAKTFRESTKTPWKRGPKNELDAFYDQNGWFPALHPDEKETVKDVVPWEKRQAVAVTQAASYDAWCLSELAREVGDDAGAKEFGAQVTNYRKLWKADSQFFHPKDKDGKWIEPFDYKSSGGFAALHYYDENNAWTYLWDIQHDIPGLIALFGGGKAMEAKLDRMQGESLGKRRFEWTRDLPDSTGMIGQFSMGNEPSFHIPYLYVHAGNPRKTQKFVRKVLSTWFRNDLMGIPGDEDGGGMSAFVVFSMMGFYPITPGLPQYTWGSPVFRRVTIHLANGKAFTIDAPNASADAKYIQSVKIGGKAAVVCSPLRHEDILAATPVGIEMSCR